MDRRRSARYVVTETLLVVIDGAQGVETGTLVNLGGDGAYVATGAELRSGERVSLIVHLPFGTGTSLRFACMVAWRNTGQAAALREGCGLEFLTDPRTRRNQAKLFEELETRGALVRLPELRG